MTIGTASVSGIWWAMHNRGSLSIQWLDESVIRLTNGPIASL